METIKVNELAVHLGIESKELVNILKEMGFNGKNTKSKMEESELNIFFQEITKKHAVESIEDIMKEETIKKEEPKKSEEPKVKKVKKEEPKKAEDKKEEPKKEKAETPAPKKEVKPAPKKKEAETFEYNEEELKKVIEKPIEKKVRYVDTRTSNVEISNIDDEKIQSILKTDDIYGTHDKKQKLKKGGQQQSKKFEKFDNRAKKQTVIKPEILHIKIPDEITVGEFAQRIKKTASDVIKKLMGLGVMASVNQVIDFDTAALICEEFGVKYEKEIIVSLEEQVISDIEDKPEDLVPRSPVVVVMGHVDHGKTSLLDAIRNSDVTSTEAGGITQHIGAYRVKINGSEITFLDTPGHEAFTAMRARGAMATDIAILVVAADDGIMPQTVEAINHAKAANVSIVVAINKIDKEGANPDKIKQQLMEYDLVPEEWGGDVICVPISAKKNMNIDNLLESILLVAEMLELKADSTQEASGTIVESKVDKGRGIVATILIKNGTLKVGDFVVCGVASGRIRAMMDYKGNSVKSAGPSMPVSVLGLNVVPDAGEMAYVVDEKMAKNIIEERTSRLQMEKIEKGTGVTLEDFLQQSADNEVKVLKVIIKADVKGSCEAVKMTLEKIHNDEAKVQVIHSGVGGINESDVILANASKAIIIGFDVKPEAKAKQMAERDKTEIFLCKVIYDAVDEITNRINGMQAPKFEEVITGHIEVRQIFKISSIGNIAGSYVTDGLVNRDSKIRVFRKGELVIDTAIDTLQHQKDQVKTVKLGFECGIKLKGFNDIEVGDILEAYELKQI